MRHGVLQYGGTHGRWVFRGSTDPQALHEWGCQGIIAMVARLDLYEPVVRAGCPVVNVSNRLARTGLPTVHADDVAVGRTAAEHLLGLGLRHYAFVGPINCHFSTQRGEGYTAALLEANHHPHLLDRSRLRHPHRLRERDAMMQKWLADLPRPVGIFCAEDSTAERLLNVCLEQEIRVPDEVAVLGVNNDTLLCESLYPPLSSINVPFEKIGFEAARLLDSLLQGERPPDHPILLQPGSVAARRSTQLLAPEDPLVARALSLMHDRHHEELNIQDIAEYMHVSRRQLEQLFARVLGTTPANHLEKIRMDHVKRLLAESDLAMPDIAEACGYRNQTRMGVAFRRTQGMAPTAYRSQFRLRKG